VLIEDILHNDILCYGNGAWALKAMEMTVWEKARAVELSFTVNHQIFSKQNLLPSHHVIQTAFPSRTILLSPQRDSQQNGKSGDRFAQLRALSVVKRASHQSCLALSSLY
jgi:hypothetical protein